MLIPFVNFVVAFLMSDGIAKRFGRGTGFAVGLLLLPFIFYPILAWGENRYRGAIPATVLRRFRRLRPHMVQTLPARFRRSSVQGT